jgi:hypothetical protein
MTAITSAIGRLFTATLTDSKPRKPLPVRNVSYYESGQAGRELRRL